MSRGLGRLQQHILSRLQRATSEDGWPQYVNTYDLARSIRCAGPPTRSERVSVRRAVRKLEAGRLVEVSDKCEGLNVRLPLTAKQRQLEHRKIRRRLERLGWPEILWNLDNGDALPRPDSRPGRRLIQAGLPAEMLDYGWWEKRETDSGYDYRTSLPAHLRFEPQEPSWWW